MPSTLPRVAHSDTLPIVKIGPKYEGKGENRHMIGTLFEGLLTFDSCAHVPITVRTLDPTQFPSQEEISEHNMKLDFLKVRFTDLVISFSGGDFGAVHYRGTASNAEIVRNK